MQVLHPKPKVTWGQANRDFSITASSIKPTLSDQTEPLTHSVFRFSVSATAMKQTGDTSTRDGHKDNVLGW